MAYPVAYEATDHVIAELVALGFTVAVSGVMWHE
jgi:hypothetical protein